MSENWIEMSKQQPTEADFVRDEWAVEVREVDGFRYCKYDWNIFIHTAYRAPATWRKVQLAPPPTPTVPTMEEWDGSAWKPLVVTPALEQRDEAAWEKWTSDPISDSKGFKTTFLAGRQTKREEIVTVWLKWQRGKTAVEQVAAYKEFLASVGLD